VHKHLVVHVQQPFRLGIEAQRVHLLVQRCKALEQLLIQEDRIIVRRAPRCFCRLHLVNRRAGVRLRHTIQHLRDAVVELTTLLQRDDGVVKRRRSRIVCDGLDFLQVLGDPGFDRRLVVRVLDAVERRRLERQRTRRIKRIRRPKCGGGLASRLPIRYSTQ
jgi:hypothetical protein